MRMLTFSTFSPLGVLNCLTCFAFSLVLYFLISISLIMSEMLIFFTICIFFSVNFLFMSLTHFSLPLLFCKSSWHANVINPLLCVIYISSVSDIWCSLELFSILFYVYSQFYHYFLSWLLGLNHTLKRIFLLKDYKKIHLYFLLELFLFSFKSLAKLELN